MNSQVALLRISKVEKLRVDNVSGNKHSIVFIINAVVLSVLIATVALSLTLARGLHRGLERHLELDVFGVGGDLGIVKVSGRLEGLMLLS